MVNIQYNIVLIKGVRTGAKLHMLFQPMASIDKRQMACLSDGVHSIVIKLDVAEV
jgi:hypothetical protein